MKKLWLLCILTAVFASAFALATHNKVHATYNPADPNCNSPALFFTRPICNSYFYNYTPTTGPPVFLPAWIWTSGYTAGDSATSFYNFVKTSLNRCGVGSGFSSSKCTTPQLISAVGNAMIVETMLGKAPPASKNSPAGVKVAQSDLATFKSLVDAYDAAGKVDWDKVINFDDPSLTNCNGGAGRTDTLGFAQGFRVDVNTYCNNTTINAHYIVFSNPDGSFYRINRLCGNITGPAARLVKLVKFVNKPRARVTGLDPITPTDATFESSVTTEANSAPDNHGNSVNDYVKVRHYWFYVKAGTTTQIALPGGDGTATNLRLATNGAVSYVISRRIDLTPANLGGYTLKTGDKVCWQTEVTPASGYSTTAGLIGATGSPLVGVDGPHCQAIGDTPTLSCDDTSITPPNPEVGSDITASSQVASSYGIDKPADYEMTISGPSGTQTFPGSVTVPAGGTKATPNKRYTVTDAGSHTVRTVWRIGGSIKDTCTESFTGYYKPYLRVYGGDVVAGMDATCDGWGAADDNSNVFGNSKTTSPNGSGGEIGVFAVGTGKITGFNSSMLRGSPFDGTALDFANVGVTTPGQFGNSISPICPNDYASSVCGDKTICQCAPSYVCAGLGAVDFTSPGNRDYIFDNDPFAGSATPRTIAEGVHIRIEVGDDIDIGGDIQFANFSTTDVDDIPSLTLVSQGGDIRIRPAVTRLDGIYVAQGGEFNDCLVGSYSGSLPYSQCDNQLLVRGAVISTTIKLARTFGTNSDSNGKDEFPGSSSGSSACKHAGTPPFIGVCAAEVINFSPAIYLSPGPDNPQYQSITALPPIL